MTSVPVETTQGKNGPDVEYQIERAWRQRRQGPAPTEKQPEPDKK